jgi:dihydrofolate synthase/folylpolyglutamate synthase
MTDTLAAWLDMLEGRHPKSIDLGLERCSGVYGRMGSPRPAPLVFTVAGTNGKGSVVAYLSTVLGAMGYRCGTYTSPHLLRFNERVQITGVPANDQELIQAFEHTERARNGDSLTYFEFTTLAALHIMHQAGLDLAVLEVGLGGRLDTVNLVDPDCAVITAIGLDHQDYLGDDRETIGAEKAGIMRAGRPAVCADRNPPQSIRRRAGELNAELLVLGEDFEIARQSGQVQLQVGPRRYLVPMPAMCGRHQLDNFSAALTAAQLVVPGVFAGMDNWSAAVQNLRLAGRFATVPGDRRFIVDVGHNPLAARAVLAELKNMPRSDGELICVLGMLKDKDAETVTALLDEVVDSWFCAGLVGTRAQSGTELARRVGNCLPGAAVECFATVADAVNEARAKAGDDDRVLVFGSFETAASALRVFAGGNVS